MGLEKLFTKSRADRLADPDIQRGINEERDRVRKSFEKLGLQTKTTCSAVIYNTLVRPIVHKSGKKFEMASARQAHEGAVDSTVKTAALVGRILMASGRAVKYGIRRTLVI